MIFVNPFSRANFDIPNISLAYAATAFGARVVDFNTRPGQVDDLIKKKTDLLGISVRSLNVGEAKKIADVYKSNHPSTRIVSVGCGIDIQCCYPFRRWDDHLELEGEFSDSYPFPDYELFDSFPIFQKKWETNQWRYAVMTSLGCPFPCEYCMCRNRKWRARSPQNVYEELKRARERWRISSFLVLDDCFNANKKRAVRLSRLISDLGLAWECANGLRADLFDEELAEALAEGGCVQVSFGIESIDDDVLQTIKKAETFAQIEQAVKIATRYFRHVNGFFIIGLPGASYESDKRSLEWARSMGINAHFSYHVPQSLDLPDNEVFYGLGARPMSDAYPAAEQERLFLETANMRPSGVQKSIS